MTPRIFALILFATTTSHSWTLARHNNRRHQWIRRTASSSALDEEGEESSSLTFVCRERYMSDPLPPTTPQDVLKFFQDLDTRVILVSAGLQRPVEIISEVSQDMMDCWKGRCYLVGAAEPSADDILCKTQTGGFAFPGVTVRTNAYIGTKVIPSREREYPTMEMVLIQDERIVTGLAPTVWLFNLLTGNSNSEESSKKSASADTVSRISVMRQDNEDTLFVFDVYAKIAVKFPKLLLNLLPVSRERAEEQGSAAIKKTLESDILMAVKVMVEKFEAFCKQRIDR
jgi:hypothetical protein